MVGSSVTSIVFFFFQTLNNWSSVTENEGFIWWCRMCSVLLNISKCTRWLASLMLNDSNRHRCGMDFVQDAPKRPKNAKRATECTKRKEANVIRRNHFQVHQFRNGYCVKQALVWPLIAILLPALHSLLSKLEPNGRNGSLLFTDHQPVCSAHNVRAPFLENFQS